ncbi:MAG: M23 family metallopeptidase [Erythrobacter sp.]|nr:MAG: M23 family metallopeptidase [Erythrobacter sp.]
MKSPFLEKLQVAVVTATLVSAGWIVAGPILLDRIESSPDEESNPGRPGADDAGAPLHPETIVVPNAALPRGDAEAIVIPVLGVRPDDLVDSFRDERGDGTRMHQGIDIMAETGTSVIAAAPGSIARIFASDAGGNTVYIRSQDGRTMFYYAHLDAYAPGLREGMEVRRGQMLGTVGSSGNADPTAPHLHFEIMRTAPDAEWSDPATSINPYPVLSGQQN